MVERPRPFGALALFLLPLLVLYAFACLSAWWVCRAHPLASTPPARAGGDRRGLGAGRRGVGAARRGVGGGAVALLPCRADPGRDPAGPGGAGRGGIRRSTRSPWPGTTCC